MASSKAILDRPTSLQESPLHRLLQDHQVGKGEPFNFTYMDMPFGSFMVPEDKYEAFCKAYTDTVNAGVVPPLTEKQGLAWPLLVDLDFKFSSDVKQRRYTVDLVDTVVKTYFDILGEYIHLNDGNKCYVFERADPYLEEKPGKAAILKDGIHLVFSFLKCFERLKWMARDHVIQECRTLFEQLGTTNTVEDIVDKAVISTNNWFVYLSSKPNRQPYKLTRVLDNASKDIAFKQSRKLVPFISVVGDVENVSYIKELPLNSSSEKTTLAQPQETARSLPQGENSEDVDQQNDENEEHDQVQFQTLRHAVLGLQDTRAEGYEAWLKVVCGIRNISRSNNYDDDGHELIHRFSQKSATRYNDDEVDKKLSSLSIKGKGRGIGFGSIKHWLKEDNPMLQQQLFELQDKVESAIAGGGQHVDIAEVFSFMFPQQFVWITTGIRALFYKFTGTIWERHEDDAGVYKLLDTRVCQTFHDRAKYYEGLIQGEQDLAIKEKLEKKRTMSSKIARSLRNMSHLRQVYAAITKMMHNIDFLDRLDTNVDLFAFKDGVLHLPTKQFRKGQPQDMLSVYAPYNFPTTDATKREELQLFLSQIKPQDDERDYLMDQFSQCLSGRVRKQLVHIFAGPLAGNGKSTLLTLLQRAFGGYFCTMAASYLTQKSAPANNANSIILDCKRARIVGLSEPEEGAHFNAANLKALSGGDEQKAREMYSGKLTKYYPQFRLFILCNDTPEIDGKHQGLARRIRKVNFSSQFTDIKEPDLENHIYPINVDMTDKLTQWAPEFMLLLLERYRADYNDSCPEMSKLCAAYGFTKKSDVKKGLERVLATTCIEEKKLHGRKYVNCFLGYKVLPREPDT
ncbi:TPA: hypothetical protein ACH3X1_006851 [Trebouxia sp. C0004]